EVLALARWRTAKPSLEATLETAMLELAASDLDFIRMRARERSFDIWEEERGYHYFTQLVQAEALTQGADWLEGTGDAARARACRSVAAELAPSLDAYWSPADGFYRSHMRDRRRLAAKGARHRCHPGRASRGASAWSAQRARPQGAGHAGRARRPVRHG